MKALNLLEKSDYIFFKQVLYPVELSDLPPIYLTELHICFLTLSKKQE